MFHTPLHHIYNKKFLLQVKYTFISLFVLCAMIVGFTGYIYSKTPRMIAEKVVDSVKVDERRRQIVQDKINTQKPDVFNDEGKRVWEVDPARDYLTDQLTDSQIAELEQPTQPVLEECATDEWIFINDVSLYYYCENVGKQILISKGHDSVQWHSQPQFINAQHISYVKCKKNNYINLESTPLTCELIKHNLKTGLTESLISNQSISYGSFQSGGDIYYSWDSKKEQLAYYYVGPLLEEADNPDAPTYKNLYQYNLNTKTSVFLAKATEANGRWIVHDDEQKIVFSPDGTKLVFQVLSANEYGDVVYSQLIDVTQKKVIWERPEYTTFSTFLNSNKLLFKELIFSQEEYGETEYNLFTLDIPSGEKRFLTKAEGWFDIKQLDENHLIFWRDKAENGKGVETVKFNLNTNQETVWEDLLFVKMISKDFALAHSYIVSCEDPETEDECLTGGENGFVRSGSLIHNVNTGEKITDRLPNNGVFTDFDVRNFN